jgi:hypothetical protein
VISQIIRKIKIPLLCSQKTLLKHKHPLSSHFDGPRHNCVKFFIVKRKTKSDNEKKINFKSIISAKSEIILLNPLFDNHVHLPLFLIIGRR